MIFALLALIAVAGDAVAAPQPGADIGRAALPPGHVPIGTVQADLGDIKVPKAIGPNARTVLVRGKVVKFTPEILSKNWIHLRDGSGSASDNTHDVVVTTNDQARAGDVVVVKGLVRTDKDLGSGYVYKVLIEEATLQK